MESIFAGKIILFIICAWGTKGAMYYYYINCYDKLDGLQGVKLGLPFYQEILLGVFVLLSE